MFDIVNNFVSNLGKIVRFPITIMTNQKLILNTLRFLHNLFGYEVLLSHTCLTVSLYTKQYNLEANGCNSKVKKKYVV